MSEETRLDVYRGNGLVRLQSAYDSFSDKLKSQLGNGGFLSLDTASELQSALEQQGLSLSDPREKDSLIELVNQNKKLKQKQDGYSNPVLQEASQYLEIARERIRQNLYDLEAELPVGTDLGFNEPFILTRVQKKLHLNIEYAWGKFSNTGNYYFGPYLYVKFKPKKKELKLLGFSKSSFIYTDFDSVFDRMKRSYLGKYSNKQWVNAIDKILSFYLKIKTHVVDAQQKKQETIKKELETPNKSLQELIMEENNPVRSSFWEIFLNNL